MQETLKPPQTALPLQFNITEKIGQFFQKASRIYYRFITPKKGIKYIENEEFGAVSLEERMKKGFLEHRDMIVTNQSIGKHFICDAKKIVNIGSGVGTFEYNNAAEHPDTLFVASEFATSSVEWCKQHRSSPNVVYCSDDIEMLLKNYGQFDLALCVDVIEHIKDYGHFLGEFVKLADRAIITTPNRDSYYYTAELQSPPFKQHTQEFNAGELYFLLRAFYKNVTLFSFPDRYKHELVPVGIYSYYKKLVAHCNNI